MEISVASAVTRTLHCFRPLGLTQNLPSNFLGSADSLRLPVNYILLNINYHQYYICMLVSYYTISYTYSINIVRNKLSY
ncbi:hypothetical protein LINGRAHAP2_LOCUS29994 [Linum grandiflorum]